LLADGHQVAVIDDLNNFYSPSMKLANLKELRSKGLVDVFEADISEDTAVRTIMAKSPPDAVIHLAARAGVRPSLADPLLYERVNVRGTMLLLEACRELGISKFVFASSSSVYGASTSVPFREDQPVGQPVSPYAATKLAGEGMCYTYAHLYGIRTVCLRFFTVYGPRQRPDLAIRKFTNMIHSGTSIPVFGDGSSGRDYTFIDDTVQGIMAALHHDCPYDIFNLGNSHPVNLLTLIETIEDALGQKATIRWLPPQAGDVPITWADIDKAGRLLGYSPQTPFKEGIRKFVAWHLCSGVKDSV
jgi:UDP-glucuronate 4-epimerase